jgi:hypothetical protein
MCCIARGLCVCVCVCVCVSVCVCVCVQVSLHRKAKHASIVEMVGLSRDPSGGGLVLVLELMEGGDVLSHLKSKVRVVCVYVCADVCVLVCCSRAVPSRRD